MQVAKLVKGKLYKLIGYPNEHLEYRGRFPADAPIFPNYHEFKNVSPSAIVPGSVCTDEHVERLVEEIKQELH